jgi:hypothetical protein
LLDAASVAGTGTDDVRAQNGAGVARLGTRGNQASAIRASLTLGKTARHRQFRRAVPRQPGSCAPPRGRTGWATRLAPSTLNRKTPHPFERAAWGG